VSRRSFSFLSFPILLSFITFRFLTAQTDFSQENAHRLLKYLSIDIGPRTMGSPAEREALAFAVGKFKEYGCDTTYIMTFDRFSRGNTNSGIAVGIKRGVTKHIIVIGGHIDSAEPEIEGTNDDGSGSAVVIEAARVLGKRRTQSTIIFCCFGGEEQGLIGSTHFARNFTDIDSVVLMLQIDMADGSSILDFDPDAHRSLSAPKWLITAAVEEFHNLGYKNLRYPTHFFSLNYSQKSGPGSDHEPFLQQGVPAIAFVSDVGYPIHTSLDNFENFNPTGLKRSGDLIVKLVERFDGGIPSRELENYWLIMIWNIPVCIPPWGLWIFLIASVIQTIIAFIAVRKRRQPPDSTQKIRWSGIKMFLFTIIIITFGWFSADVIGLIKGVRHPWLSVINLYFLLAIIASLVGGWIALRVSLRMKLSACPYVFYKRAIIILIIFLILLGLASLKLTVEPAMALFLISAAILIRNPILRLALALTAPLWMLELVFSEWSGILFHEIARLDTTEVPRWFLFNGGIIFALSLYILPFLFAFTAVVKDSPTLKVWISKIRSAKVLIVLVVVLMLFSIYLILQPAYNNFWQRDVHIDQEYNMNKHTMNINISSSEYLDDIIFNRNGVDTSLTSRITKFNFEPKRGFDTNWVSIFRKEEKNKFGDTTHYDIELTLSTKFRPYTVSISYSINGKELNAFDTPHQFRTDKTGKRIDWYSFPDSILTIPVKFSVIGNDSVKEKIEIVFDKLAYPIKVKGEMVYVVPRTKVIQEYSYSYF